MGRRIRFPDFQLLSNQASKVGSTCYPLAGNGVAKLFLEPWLLMTYRAVPASSPALLHGSSLTSDEYTGTHAALMHPETVECMYGLDRHDSSLEMRSSTSH